MDTLLEKRTPVLLSFEKGRGKLVCYEGFFLKPGYLYGRDERGRPVATSGWTVRERICLYVKENGAWQQHWMRKEDFHKQFHKSIGE